MKRQAIYIVIKGTETRRGHTGSAIAGVYPDRAMAECCKIRLLGAAWRRMKDAVLRVDEEGRCWISGPETCSCIRVERHLLGEDLSFLDNMVNETIKDYGKKEE